MAKAPVRERERAASKSRGRVVDEDDVEEAPRGSAKSRNASDDEDDVPPSRKAKAATRDEDGGDDVINWSDVNESGGEFELLPRGIYDCVVQESTFSLSKNTNNPMITLTLEVAGGDFDGRKLWHRVVLSAKSLGMVKANMKALGVKMPTKPQSMSQAAAWMEKLADSGDLINAEVKANVKISEYQGEKRNEVRGIKAAGGADSEVAEGDEDFVD